MPDKEDNNSDFTINWQREYDEKLRKQILESDKRRSDVDKSRPLLFPDTDMPIYTVDLTELAYDGISEEIIETISSRLSQLLIDTNGKSLFDARSVYGSALLTRLAPYGSSDDWSAKLGFDFLQVALGKDNAVFVKEEGNKYNAEQTTAATNASVLTAKGYNIPANG